ncbi:MAG: hypothetical protein RL441_639, partial [Actinomycetota bacterium]
MDHSYSRLFILRMLVLSLFVALVGRLFVMQVVDGDQFREQAANSRFRDVVVPSTRGVVLDQAGRVLIGNRRTMVVSVSIQTLSALEDGGARVIKELAPLLGMKPSELAARIKVCDGKTAKPPTCWNGSAFQP